MVKFVPTSCADIKQGLVVAITLKAQATVRGWFHSTMTAQSGMYHGR